LFTSCLPRSAWVRGRILGRWQSGSFEHAAGDGWWLAVGEEPAGEGSGGGNAEDGDGEAAIVLYGVFMIVERTARTPLMHPNLLSRRPIAAGAFLIFIAAGVLIADLFLGSQYLQHLRGLSALETGVFFLPAAWPS
jgi:hypothetical protein